MFYVKAKRLPGGERKKDRDSSKRVPGLEEDNGDNDEEDQDSDTGSSSQSDDSSSGGSSSDSSSSEEDAHAQQAGLMPPKPKTYKPKNLANAAKKGNPKGRAAYGKILTKDKKDRNGRRTVKALPLGQTVAQTIREAVVSVPNKSAVRNKKAAAAAAANRALNGGGGGAPTEDQMSTTAPDGEVLPAFRLEELIHRYGQPDNFEATSLNCRKLVTDCIMRIDDLNASLGRSSSVNTIETQLHSLREELYTAQMVMAELLRQTENYRRDIFVHATGTRHRPSHPTHSVVRSNQASRPRSSAADATTAREESEESQRMRNQLQTHTLQKLLDSVWFR
jgi:hypothetical protein